MTLSLLQGTAVDRSGWTRMFWTNPRVAALGWLSSWAQSAGARQKEEYISWRRRPFSRLCSIGTFNAQIEDRGWVGVQGCPPPPSASTRDIKRLPTTTFSLVLHKGIFWPSSERLSRSTLHLKEGGEMESVLLYSVVFQMWRPASTPRCG